MPKLVSVIIPAFNEEKLIEKTLISLKKQDYQPIEIIVVDNGSTDRTQKIAQKYTNKVFYFKKRGSSRARNFGAKMAKGNYLVFLDADTRVSKNTISAAVKSLNQGWVGGTVKIIYESKNNKIKFMENSQNFCLKKWKTFETPFLYLKKEVFEKSGKFPESREFGESMILLKRISKFGELKYDAHSKIITSPRRYIRNKDYFYVILGGALVLAGISNVPYYPVREIEEFEKKIG